MLRRIFIAINLPEDIKDKLLIFSEKYSRLPARWTERENIHITLNFLGNLDENQLLETIKTAKEVALKHNSFLLRIEQVCYGPLNKFPPRMVWVLGEKGQEILGLQNDLENVFFDLPSYQYKIKESRRFFPHITLARIKSFEFRRLGEGIEIDEALESSFEVNSIEVIESQSKKTGVEYAILESIELGS